VEAVEVQTALAEANSGLAPNNSISRIGIHIGDVMVRQSLPKKSARHARPS